MTCIYFMLPFSKYNSCGNDFIIIDDRDLLFPINGGSWTKYPENDIQSGQLYINSLCDRKKGIGSDGLILLQPSTVKSKYLYHMAYFNSDGLLSSFCGNGSMCCAHFASIKGLAGEGPRCHGHFHTTQGIFSFQSNIINHKTTISMIDVAIFQIDHEGIYINTGSPHYVLFKDSIDKINVNKEGADIRYSQRFKEEGVNVTFASYENQQLSIRTYERGVERETLSCGTGAVAAALCAYINQLTSKNSISVQTQGGILYVSFKKRLNIFVDIYLESTVEKNFEGILPTV